MTAENFKNLLDNEIVEYLNTHTLPVDDKWLNHPSYKPIWSQEFWEKYVDVYYLKKKLFRRYLENQSKQGIKSIFFEIYSKKQLLQAIEIFKHYAERCNTRIDKCG